MNKQISRRNLIKLLGISGASIPLTGLINSKKINLNKNPKESIPIKLSSNENPYGPSKKLEMQLSKLLMKYVDILIVNLTIEFHNLKKKLLKEKVLIQEWYL